MKSLALHGGGGGGYEYTSVYIRSILENHGLMRGVASDDDGDFERVNRK